MGKQITKQLVAPVDDLMMMSEVEILDPNSPYTYVKYNVPGFYVEFPKKLDEDQFDNLGTTIQDFYNNKWVLLSKEQTQFHLDNPTASIKEVLAMEITSNVIHEPSLEELILKAKLAKLNELYVHDNSTNVNEFSINGELKTWFTPELRANYKNSIDSAKLLDVDTLLLLVDNKVIKLSTDKAALILAMILLYADTCYIVTKQHEISIEGLETIEEIEAYDITKGYPEKLDFSI